MQNKLEGLQLKEQIGQLIMAGFPGTAVNPEITDLIQNHHIGGVILFAHNIESVQQVKQLTSDLQRIAREAGHRHPLLIAIDQENGMVRRLGQYTTEFPGNMAQGAIGSEQVAYDIAYATGLELKALGINMNLAPDVDVNNNPANPVIGVRSFGEDPEQVARLAVAAVKGYKDAGVISNIKHFPGHGDTATDSHLALPTIPHDLDRLEKIELIPFKRGIEAGADSIMIAHLYLPELMKEELLPATISPAIVRDLLREKLGYQGLITTDCMEMNALAETIGVEQGTLRALQAGIDIVLVSHRYDRQVAALTAIKAAVEQGELAPETIARAAERILELKARTLHWDNSDNQESVTSIVRNDTHLALSKQAYELSTTIVRNEQGILPVQLKPEDQLLLIIPYQGEYTQAADKRYGTAESLIENLQQRHANLQVRKFDHELTETDYQELDAVVATASLIIVVTVNANLNKHQGTLVRHLLQSQRPLIGLATFNPYDLLEFPELKTYVVTYEYTPPALTSAVRVLFGEIEAQGHLPVSIPGLHSLH